MAFYPTIDYQGAARDIVGQWSDLPRVDRERENTAMQRQLQEKQMTLYGLQSRKSQMEMDQLQEELALKKSLSAGYRAHEAAGDFNSTTEYIEDPRNAEADYDSAFGGVGAAGPTLTSVTKPPKMEVSEYVAKTLAGNGDIGALLKIQKEALEAKKVKEEIFSSRQKNLIDLVKAGQPTLAKNLAKTYSADDKRFDAFGGFDYDKTTGITQAIINNPLTGKPYGYVNYGPDGKSVGGVISFDEKERADTIAKLGMQYSRAVEEGNLKEAKVFKRALDVIGMTNAAGRPIPPIAVPTEGGGMGLASRTSPGAITDIPGAVGKQDKPVGLKATDKAEMNSAIAEKRRLNKLLSEPTAMVSKVKEKIAAGTPLTTREREWKNQWDNAEQTIQRVKALEDSQGSSQSKMKKVTKLPEGSRNTGHKGPHGRPLFVTPDNRYFEAD